ncbi:MAG: FAD-dependent monooxygenase [Bacteroidota bacterium]
MKFLISGGGICGLTMAIILQKQGHEEAVYEAAPKIKAVGAGLVLSTNAIKALQSMGISKQILAQANLLDHFDIRLANGSKLMETNARKLREKYDAIGNTTIHRAELHQVLLELLAEKVKFFTNKRTVETLQDAKGVTLKFTDGTTAEGDFLLACDGINSPTRRQLLPQSSPRYAGYTCWRAVIQYPEGAFKTKEATETWGKNGRFGVVPLINNRIYWFACINTPKVRDKKMKAYTVADLKAAFNNYHQPIPQILALTKDKDLLWNDIEDIKPIAQFAFERILLAGDAAHATTPNMGQGACQAMEDAAILYQLLKSDKDVTVAFKEFEKIRLPRTTKIVNTSWTLGKAAQMTNPILTTFRNFALKMTPRSVNEKQMDFLFDVTFE